MRKIYSPLPIVAYFNEKINKNTGGSGGFFFTETAVYCAPKRKFSGAGFFISVPIL